MHGEVPSRRRFLTLLPGAVLALAGGASRLEARAPGHALPSGASEPLSGPHPDPRPGIDGSGVLTAEELGGNQGLIELYDGIREIPHVADGVYCYCGCAEYAGYRSLLECYQENGMAMACRICQGEGELVIRRHADGESLDQIRRAIDARYGRGT